MVHCDHEFAELCSPQRHENDESLSMYPRTKLLSVQNHSTTFGISSSSKSVELTFTEIRAAVSSS